MRIRSVVLAIALLGLSLPAYAATKLYDSSAENGTPGDFLNQTTNLCPPLQTTPDLLRGFAQVEDDGLGTVTLTQRTIEITTFIDLGPDQLVVTFGPGAFIFIDAEQTESLSAPQTSNTSGVGAHGPSGTAANESAEWGITSGWVTAGDIFCLSSPVTVCNNAEFAHGQTIPPALPSTTYDLGTWSFDGVGDYESDSAYIQRTSNGGLQNSRYVLRGAFVGSALPALPLIGFGTLALALATLGGRALMGRR